MTASDDVAARGVSAKDAGKESDAGSEAVSRSLGAGANPSDTAEWTIVRLLYEASRAFRRTFERRARAHGFTRSQWWVLMRLSYCEGIRQITLAQALDIPPIVLVRLIDRLEEAGLVERRVDPTDRRARTLHLTAEAHPQIERLRAIAEEVRDAAVSDLDDTDRAQLIALLGRVHGRLGALAAADVAEANSSEPFEDETDDEPRNRPRAAERG